MDGQDGGGEEERRIPGAHDFELSKEQVMQCYISYVERVLDRFRAEVADTDHLRLRQDYLDWLGRLERVDAQLTRLLPYVNRLAHSQRSTTAAAVKRVETNLTRYIDLMNTDVLVHPESLHAQAINKYSRPRPSKAGRKGQNHRLRNGKEGPEGVGAAIAEGGEACGGGPRSVARKMRSEPALGSSSGAEDRLVHPTQEQYNLVTGSAGESELRLLLLGPGKRHVRKYMHALLEFLPVGNMTKLRHDEMVALHKQ